MQQSHKTDSNIPQPASFFRRMGALIYDSFIMFSFMLLLSAFALWVNQGRSFNEHQILFLSYLFIGCGLFVGWFWQKSGQTLGMLAWKIKVVDQNYHNLTWKRSFLRYIWCFINLVLGGIGYLWCFIYADKQSLQDKLSGTKVIRV